MNGRHRWRRRVRALVRRSEVEREMEEEMRFHLEMEIEDRVRSGMSPEEARRTALRDFGGVERFKEEVRDVRGWRWLDEGVADARFALRTFRRYPGFTLVAVLTLALGIGANTAVFSVVHGTLLRPLPYPEPDRIVTLWEVSGEGEPLSVTGGNFLDWQRRSRSFAALALHGNPHFGAPQTVLGANDAVRAWVNDASRDLFRVFGVRPVLGRSFTPEESREGGAAVAVVSHSFWKNHLGGDAGVLGRTLDVSGEAFEVVGVMPPGFHYPGETDIWVPLERWGIVENRQAHNYLAVGRLREGVELAAARRELNQVTASLRAEHGGEMDAVAVKTTPLQEELVGDLRRPLYLLLGAAALVLLIACTNLASALLARGAMREREVAIRASLGADRWRVVRQLFTESLVLALVGAAVGVGVAALLLDGLLSLAPGHLAPVTAVRLDGWALGFALLVAVVTAVLFGLAPALRLSAGAVGEALRSGARGTSGRSRRGLWGLLVGTEVALALLLLIGSGLLIRSFAQLLDVETGFDPERVLTVELSLPGSRYDSDPRIASYYRRLLGELEHLPGVRDAGLIQHLPLSGVAHTGDFEIEGRGRSSAAGVHAGYRVAAGDYFRAMGIPLVRGRLFEERDDAGVGDVAIVNTTLAERIWPGEDPIGKRIRNLANDSWKYPDRWLTVVGVVGGVRHGGLLDEVSPEIYVHYLQRPNRARAAVLTLRTTVPPERVIAPARAVVRSIDPEIPAEFATMSTRIVHSVGDRRFTMLVLASFALVALVLAAVGIYGVVSYAVARRTREIGIRLALGAPPRAVRTLLQRSTMSVVLVGLAAGIAGAVWLSRVLESLLFGVSATDPLTFAVVTAALAGIAWLASYIPARRTTRVDPMITMRAE